MLITTSGFLHNGLPYVLVDGKVRVLAVKPPTPQHLARRRMMKKFVDAVHPLIPREQWVEFEEDDSDLPLLDQNGKGSCVGHGGVTCFQHSWNRSGYDPSLHFSACWIYGNINGGQDNGAVVQDAIDLMKTKGVCLESTVPELMIYASQFPAAATAEAGHYKAQDFYLIDTPDEIGTAVQLRHLVATGKDVPRNFTPDASGVLPPYSGQSMGGHCMATGLGMKKINGIWYVGERNSWGRWGLNGNCWTPLDSYYQRQSGHFVLIHPSRDNDPNQPPVPSV